MSDASSSAPAANSAAPAQSNTSADALPATETAEELLNAEKEAGVTEEEDGSKEKKDTKEIKSNKKKYKLKVDGQDLEEELDLNNEEEIKKHLQMSRAAQKRMKESADLRSQQQKIQTEIMEFIQQLRDPDKAARVLSDPRIGMDIKKFAQHILNQEIEDLQKSPEQKEREKIQQELEQLKAEKETAAKQAEEERRIRLQNEYASELNKDIEAALEKHQLPKKPYIIRRIAEQLMSAIENGITGVKVEDVAPFVYKQWKQDLREAIDGSPEDIIEQLIGSDTVDRLRRYRIRNMKKSAVTPSKMKETVAPTSTDDGKQGKRQAVNMHSFFRNLKGS